MSQSADNKTGGPASKVPMDAMWQDNGSERATSDPAFLIDVDGYEGPLDLLLHLARNQKVDLTQISVLALARQYLTFIEHAKALRIELAADYLVMAAWLAYLKSRLLIPKPKSGDDEPSGEEMAAILQFRLQRLEAMRDAATKLINRNRLGRDVFVRGAPETVVLEKKSEFVASLYDLLAAYAGSRQRETNDEVLIARRRVWSLKDARAVLTRLIGDLGEWSSLNAYLMAYLPEGSDRRSAIASVFAASLEMVREGQLEIKQEKAFAPIMLRDAQPSQKMKTARKEQVQ